MNKQVGFVISTMRDTKNKDVKEFQITAGGNMNKEELKNKKKLMVCDKTFKADSRVGIMNKGDKKCKEMTID
jgi:hypothetical protein